MPKLVNGVIVPDGEASGGSSSSSSSGSNNAKKFLTQPVRLGSRSVPLYALLGVVVLVGGVVAGPKGAFYVLVAAAIVFALKHCNQRSASSSSSSSSSSRRGRTRKGGPNIKGIGDLPKPPPSS